jgi:hypothetical protein|tara:strand:- start:1989 stop:2177 length:189 start_codon:yes stop_codon:yes gene_type:complete
MDKFILYSVEGVDGKPRLMFSSFEEAEKERQEQEYVVEYQFVLEEKIPVVYPAVLTLDVGEE